LAGGSNGLITFHSSSSSSGLAMWVPPESKVDTGDIHQGFATCQSFC
jgi:hypothetical protein